MKRVIAKSLLAATVMALTVGVASAETVTLRGHFIAEGSATSHPKGRVTARLDTVTHKLRYWISYSGLTGPVTMAHFHGPADVGVSAGVLVPITDKFPVATHGKIKGQVMTISDQAQTALLADQSYVNLHTKAYPSGEARAQLYVSHPHAHPAKTSITQMHHDSGTQQNPPPATGGK